MWVAMFTGAPPYLGKGQTVLVLVSVLHLEIIKCFALGRGLRQGPNALDVAGRQEAVSPMQLPMVPVLIHSAPQNDDVALAELEVARFFPLVTVECLPIGKLGESLKAKQHHVTQHGLPPAPLDQSGMGGSCAVRAYTECSRVVSTSKEQAPQMGILEPMALLRQTHPHNGSHPPPQTEHVRGGPSVVLDCPQEPTHSAEKDSGIEAKLLPFIDEGTEA